MFKGLNLFRFFSLNKKRSSSILAHLKNLTIIYLHYLTMISFIYRGDGV